jgi:cholesterol oxidase
MTLVTLDAIVVGSGFGGSVCAARLAQRGLRTLILERGPWWGPLQRDRAATDRRELPRGPLGVRKLVRNLRVARRGRRRERVYHVDGLLEGHRFEHLMSVTASGVGGGSHIYTAVLEEPDAAFFDAFPPEITAGELRPYFDRVREMLRPRPVPTPPEKDRVFAQAVADAGLPPSEYADLAIAWGRDPAHPETVLNAASVEQRSSTFTGDAFVGCQDGSKTTLDLTYVPWALRHGAELRPLCEVLAIGRGAGGGYTVRYRDHRSGQTHEASARRLVLAAGGLNTQRLLFDARDGHGGLPDLPATLGRRFSPNADFGALLWRTAVLHDSSYGPSFGALSRIRGADGLRFVLGEVGIPVEALPLPGLLRSLLRSSTLLFCMGRDASAGTIGFDGVGLTTSARRSLDPALYAEMESAMMRVARHYHPRRTWAGFLTGRDPDGLFTVHPLGGCAMGRTAEEGFTDHVGQVFGHPGLFVADGSLYPRSPGIPPSMTIAALAERQADLMA